MQSAWKVVGVSVLSVMGCLALFTVTFSFEGQGNDMPAIQQLGKTIHGNIVKVVKSDAASYTWDVSVEDDETGEVITLHLARSTAKMVTDIDPAVGEKVVVKYDENNKHAITFAAVASTKK